MRTLRHLLSTLILFGAVTIAAAQGKSPIKIVNLAELSGSGASAGTNLKNGVELAFKEINAAGGILGRPVEVTVLDTQTAPGVAKALATKAVDMGAYAVIGPIYSGSVIVSMTETQRAEIPNFVGAEAANITEQNNPYVFRCSLTQAAGMPKILRYLSQNLHAKSIALVWIVDDMGKGGRDIVLKAAQSYGIRVAADLSVDPGQLDVSGAVLKVKQANADAAFIYLHEEESARILRELRKQGYDKPIIGETTVVGQKVIELAGDAANGVQGQVGLTVDAPLATVKAFDEKFLKAYKYRSDHNGMKGYLAAYTIKAVTEKLGKVDSKALAKAMHGLTLAAKDYPGVLMDLRWDQKGDVDLSTFIVEVKNGKQVVIATLPPSGSSN